MIDESSGRIAMEGGSEDRISSLPQNVIDHILDCMPIRDAARTITLSRKWRKIWAEYPNLVLDEQFAKEIERSKDPFDIQVDYVNTVNRILLQHSGNIPKFVLHFPKVPSTLFSVLLDFDMWKICSNIDNWILFLSRKDVKELTLENSNLNHYRIPSYLFSFPKLTYLSISKFILRAPIGSKGFAKLTSLKLNEVTFESSLLIIPQLIVLSLRNCRGIRLLSVSAPLLRRLTLYDNDDFELSSYVECKNLVYAYIAVSNVVEDNRWDESINLTIILGCWPMLSSLYLDGTTLKCLTAGAVADRLPSRVKHLKYLVLFRIKYDLDEMACILCLLRSSPRLSRLEIWARQIINSDMKTVEYLGEPGVMGQCLNQLKTVMMKVYKNSAAELLLVQLLLASSPTLDRMCVEENQKLAPSERLEIAKELMQLPRASSKTQVIFQRMVKPKNKRIRVA